MTERSARHDRRGMGVDQVGELVPVPAVKRAHFRLDGMADPSIQAGRIRKKGRYQCGTPAL